MARQLANFPDVSGTYYFDADGDMLYSSDPQARSSNVADRPFFLHLRERADNVLEFSDALVARTTGRLSVVIARGVRDETGRFLGVVTALLDLETYARLLSAMDVGAHSTIVLRRSDTFNLVTRYPPLPEQGIAPLVADNPLRLRIAAGERSGTLTYRAQQDGVARMSSFRVLEQYPLYLYVGIAPDQYLAGWRQQAVGAGILAATLLLVFGFAALRLRRNDALVAAAQHQILDSEARLATILGSLDASVYVADINTHEVLFINRHLRDRVGDVVGQLCWKTLQSGMTGPCDFCTSPLLLAADGTPNDSYTWENFNPALGRWYQRHDCAIRWSDGRLVRMQIALDITERKQAEASLHEIAQELLRSNSELEQFSYSISHDMRQPLRMISSYLQLLQKGLGDTLDAEQREYFHFAIDGAQRLDAMLRGLLDYSRVGRQGDPPVWIDSRAALDEALLFLRPLVAEAQAAVRIEGEWPRLLASPDELLRLLQNLIGNALKFRVAGRPPVVTLSSEVSAGHWRLCVADNGVGILPDQIGRLFQVFQRLQSRTDYEGTGIGLALCRKIAENLGGKIWAESAGEGLGSRFCVGLPLPQETST
jgi:signal transduction histidine kinase